MFNYIRTKLFYSTIQIKEKDDEIKILETMTKENCKFLTLKDNIYNAKIVYIYDGDTMHVVFKVFDTFYKWNCRIMGVDTPELRSKNIKEKKLGYIVRDILIKKLLNKIVKIECYEFDKYGRLLIDVYMPNEEIKLSEWLIQNNYAYKYDGGTKQNWEDIL
jgi:micrococcal nuclease